MTRRLGPPAAASPRFFPVSQNSVVDLVHYRDHLIRERDAKPQQQTVGRLKRMMKYETHAPFTRFPSVVELLVLWKLWNCLSNSFPQRYDCYEIKYGANDEGAAPPGGAEGARHPAYQPTAQKTYSARAGTFTGHKWYTSKCPSRTISCRCLS